MGRGPSARRTLPAHPQGRELFREPRRSVGVDRRIGIGQDHGVAGHHGVRQAGMPDRRGQRQPRRDRGAVAEHGRAPAVARAHRRLCRPKRRRRLQPGADNRRAGDRIGCSPRAVEPTPGKPTRRVALPGPGTTGPGTVGKALSAPGLRRPVAKAHGRDGALRKTGPPATGRTHDGAGRHDPDRGAESV